MNNKTVSTVVLSLALFLGLFAIVPSQAHADFNPLRIIDPFCLFSCDDDEQVVYNTTVDSYNTNSYNTNTTHGANSPIVQTHTAVAPDAYVGAVYGTTPTTAAPTYSAPVYNPPVYNSPVNNAPVYNTPVYNNTPIYNAPVTPVYAYNPPQYSHTSPLQVSCYSSPTYGNVGSVIQWSSSVNGGTGSYAIYWSGTEGLSGYGSSITKSYGYAGTKSATITVTSGSQTVTQNCSGAVTIYDYNYNNPTPTYYPPHSYQSPLAVSCRANTTFSPVGSYVTWTASPTGGSGSSYSYTWSGTDGFYGSQSSVSTYYHTAGVKTAYVTVQSGNQSASAQCSNSVTIGSPVAQNPVYPGSSVIQVACAASKTTATVGTPVTWNSEAYGGTGRFIYSWSGTDHLIGTQSSAITSYATAGKKSAIVTVTASNGQSVSKVCENTVTVKSATVAKNTVPKITPTVTITPTPTPEVIYLPLPTENTASSLFSLKNVPWGWVAILVILVLFGMISYLLFNKKKI